MEIDLEPLTRQLHQKFIEKKLTLSAAESCTGGHFAAALTLLPGASSYFLGSVVAYSNEWKIKFLGVKKASLDCYGAVSKEVALEMLSGILKHTGSDYAIAVTGIAGPSGGSIEKPPGTVWCAVGKSGCEPDVWQLQAVGSRLAIIQTSVEALLKRLLIQLEKYA